MAPHASLTLADRAYLRIREAILSGDVEGWPTLAEPALARRLRISRTPVREALQRLAREGLVRLVPQRGAVVSVLTPDDWRELFDLREMLEGLAARLAAERISAGTLDEVTEAYRALAARRARNMDELKAFGRLLHGAIMREARSPRLEEMISLVGQQVQLLGEFQLAAEGRAETAFREHGDLIGALRAREPDAAESLMRLHVRNSRETAFLLLARSGRPSRTGGKVAVQTGRRHGATANGGR